MGCNQQSGAGGTIRVDERALLLTSARWRREIKSSPIIPSQAAHFSLFIYSLLYFKLLFSGRELRWWWWWKRVKSRCNICSAGLYTIIILFDKNQEMNCMGNLKSCLHCIQKIWTIGWWSYFFDYWIFFSPSDSTVNILLHSLRR
jgi:hypothetical protein